MLITKHILNHKGSVVLIVYDICVFYGLVFLKFQYEICFFAVFSLLGIINVYINSIGLIITYIFYILNIQKSQI